MAPLLEVRQLTTRFDTPEGEVAAVTDVSFTIGKGDCVGIVGESGSGKSQVFMSLMGLLDRNGRATGSALFQGQELLGMPPERLNKIRGSALTMIFQDPMTSLNPFMRVGRQLTEVLTQHKGMDETSARSAVVAMLDRVRIPEAAQRMTMYPHEFSGGMRQRVMIAMALLGEPDLLIADEPTTALDVTIQAQILNLLAEIRRELGTAVIMITHDLGVVAGLCERVMVMYAGRIVESASVDEIYYDPQHPYTAGLLESMPRLEGGEEQDLKTIPGQPPNLQHIPAGCAYRERCFCASDMCRDNPPPALREMNGGRLKACHRDSL